MEFYEILSNQSLPEQNQDEAQQISQEVLQRVIWAGWKTNTLRNYHPWKVMVFGSTQKDDFWNFMHYTAQDFFTNVENSEFFTKYYHSNFSYGFFKKHSLSTLLICVDKQSYINELSQLKIYEANSSNGIMNFEMGKIIQNIENAVFNEGLTPYTLFLEPHIPFIARKIYGYLSIPENFLIASIISIFNAGESKNTFDQRPLETFVYNGKWNSNPGTINECPKASSCKRFKFLFPKSCPVCGKSVAKTNHFHDVSRGLIYCEDDFFNILELNGEYNEYDSSHLKPKLIPKLCEYSIDCLNYSLYLPKLCFVCNGEMDSHFHDIHKEIKYCYSCAHNLFGRGTKA